MRMIFKGEKRKFLLVQLSLSLKSGLELDYTVSFTSGPLTARCVQLMVIRGHSIASQNPMEMICNSGRSWGHRIKNSDLREVTVLPPFRLCWRCLAQGRPSLTFVTLIIKCGRGDSSGHPLHPDTYIHYLLLLLSFISTSAPFFSFQMSPPAAIRKLSASVTAIQ